MPKGDRPGTTRRCRRTDPAPQRHPTFHWPRALSCGDVHGGMRPGATVDVSGSSWRMVVHASAAPGRRASPPSTQPRSTAAPEAVPRCRTARYAVRLIPGGPGRTARARSRTSGRTGFQRERGPKCRQTGPMATVRLLSRSPGGPSGRSVGAGLRAGRSARRSGLLVTFCILGDHPCAHSPTTPRPSPPTNCSGDHRLPAASLSRKSARAVLNMFGSSVSG